MSEMNTLSCLNDYSGSRHPIPVAAVADIIRNVVTPVDGIVLRDLDHAAGWTLAGNLRANEPFPPFDQSAVDGYAFHRREFGAALRIAGLTRAGEPRRWIAEGEALHVMTGAPVPRGADRVAMQERCTVEDGVVTPPCLLPSGTNIRRRGEDVGIGDLLVPALKRLDARHIAILAAAGHGRVSCIRALRIGLIATGDELVVAAAEPVPFRVRDSNTPMLTALLSAAPDIELEIVRCRDSVDEITESIAEMSETCDLVITTGGMSFGVEDHVRSACLRLGGRFALHAVAMKPGKPVGLAILPNCILLGLPGNPFAAFATFLVVGREVLACLRGRRPDHLSRPAIADFEIARRPGRSEFFPVGVSGYDHTGLPKLRRLGKGGSARLMPLTLADGLGCIAAETPIVSKNDPIEFIDMRQAFDVQ
ncbi:MAG: molybdopterin molybdotransferase MoeA [Paracoccaceae bacterium]|nr:molybdopterin molybdotransferase MoeA [Paracoccaceae bacterium]